MTVQDTGRQTAVYNKVLSFNQAFVGSIEVVTPGSYDPVTEVTTGETTANHDAACVFKKVSRNEATPDNFVISDTQNYRAVIFAAKGIVPNKDNVATLLGETYSILGAVESSAGDDSLFTLYVKKGI